MKNSKAKLKTKPFKPKIIVILGPTASGKSDLAVKLSEKFNGEIISADSRQIYKELDIGTAKPPKSDMKKIRHYLIDVKNPDQNYTVSQYKDDCLKAIKKILAKNKLPIIAGGTGLYIKAVVDNLEIPEVKANPRLRKKLEKELKSKGLGHLYQELIRLDPEAAYIVDSKNPRRVIRALEITLETNKPFSSQRKKGKKLFDTLKIGINVPKDKLKEKIYKRVDIMLKSGLVEEVKKLIEKYSADKLVFDAIGYKETINYLQGKNTIQEATDLIKKNTWHYTKRQMTWFRKDKEIIWITNPEQAFAMCRDWLGL